MKTVDCSICEFSVQFHFCPVKTRLYADHTIHKHYRWSWPTPIFNSNQDSVQ